MEIKGENIPFTLLIRDAQDDTIASYIPQNKMILGISESVSPLYFYTDIKPNSEGEVFINYKKGVSNVFAYINNRDKSDDINNKDNWGKHLDSTKGSLTYNNYNNRIKFTTEDTNNCENGCELYIGIYIYDYELNDADDFSFFLKYTDDTVSILPNEFVFGNLYENQTDKYSINIQKDINNVDFILECDFCKVKINEVEYSGLDKLYKYPKTTSNNSPKDQILNIEISPNTSLTYPQFYSFKLIVPNDGCNIPLGPKLFLLDINPNLLLPKLLLIIDVFPREEPIF